MANNITNRFAAYCFAFVSVAVSIVILIFLRPYFLPFISVFVAALISQMSYVSMHIDTGNYGKFRTGIPRLTNIIFAIDHIRKGLPDHKYKDGYESLNHEFESAVDSILDEYERMSNGISMYTESFKKYEHYNTISSPFSVNFISLLFLFVFLRIYCHKCYITLPIFIIGCFAIYALIQLIIYKFITSGMYYNEPEIPEEKQTPAALDWWNSSTSEILEWFENERCRIWPVLNPRMEWLSKWQPYERNVTIFRTVYLTIIIFLTILMYYGFL